MNALRKTVAILRLSALLSAGCALPASATGIPVFDAGNFAQNIVTALNTVTSVTNQATQIANELEMIKNQARSLKTLDPSVFSQADANLNQQIAQMNGIVSEAKGLGFSLDGINSQFRTLFPEGTEWSKMDGKQYSPYFRKWSDEIQNSARLAMKSQSVIGDVQRSNAETQQILMQSKGADGEVRQLQSVNSMLGNMSGQFNTMTSVMATSNRLTATAIAKADAEEASQRAAMERFNTGQQLPNNNSDRF